MTIGAVLAIAMRVLMEDETTLLTGQKQNKKKLFSFFLVESIAIAFLNSPDANSFGTIYTGYRQESFQSQIGMYTSGVRHITASLK